MRQKYLGTDYKCNNLITAYKIICNIHKWFPNIKFSVTCVKLYFIHVVKTKRFVCMNI